MRSFQGTIVFVISGGTLIDIFRQDVRRRKVGRETRAITSSGRKKENHKI